MVARPKPTPPYTTNNTCIPAEGLNAIFDEIHSDYELEITGMRVHELAIQRWLNRSFFVAAGYPIPVLFTTPMAAFADFNTQWAQPDSPLHYLLALKDKRGTPIYTQYPTPIQLPLLTVKRNSWRYSPQRSFSLQQYRNAGYATISDTTTKKSLTSPALDPAVAAKVPQRFRLTQGQIQLYDFGAAATNSTQPWRAFSIVSGQLYWGGPVNYGPAEPFTTGGAGNNYAVDQGQLLLYDSDAATIDPTQPWRALSVFNGQTVLSDPVGLSTDFVSNVLVDLTGANFSTKYNQLAFADAAIVSDDGVVWRFLEVNNGQTYWGNLVIDEVAPDIEPSFSSADFAYVRQSFMPQAWDYHFQLDHYATRPDMQAFFIQRLIQCFNHSAATPQVWIPAKYPGVLGKRLTRVYLESDIQDVTEEEAENKQRIYRTSVNLVMEGWMPDVNIRKVPALWNLVNKAITVRPDVVASIYDEIDFASKPQIA